MRPRLAVAAVSALALAAALGACSRNTGSSGGNDGKTAAQTSAIATNPKDSRGPAKPVPGAQRGGTVNYLTEQDFEHLDPQRTYIVDANAVEQLFIRTLTMFKETGDGKLTLVGDLATTPGKDVNGDCKVWQYTLKDNLKYEDGSPITARDVAYGIARSFTPSMNEGPHYIPQWLTGTTDYFTKYGGPYNGAGDLPPGVTVQGDKQLTLTFPRPECDLPFAASMTTTAPVPKAKDTGTNYDLRPFSSGPYKIDSYTRGTSLTLSRNPYWDPKTDAVRHDYFDRFVVQIGPDDSQQANRLIASNGDDAYGTMYQNIPQALLAKVQSTPDLKKRMVQGLTPFVSYLAINTQRVKDVKVRQALQYALDRNGYLQARGGTITGQPASTLESPLTIGYQKYDAYPGPKSGDPKKAKQLLGNRHPKLVYAFQNTTQQQQLATVVRDSLQKAGFQVVLKPIDKSSYYDTIGRKNNPYDLYINTWAADWPSGATVLPPLFDGTTITDEGNNDYSYLNAPDVNAKIKKLQTEPAAKAASGWAELDKYIMQKYAPVVPIIDTSNVTMTGAKCHGVILGQVLGVPVYYNAWLSK